MRAVIGVSRAAGPVTAPPSKSCAHRLLICSALAGTGSTVHGVAESEDILATLDCIAGLGGSFSRNGDKVEMISPVTYGTELPILPCRESGSTLRFFVPSALALRGGAQMQGSPRLMERGIGIYEKLFRPRGVEIQKAPESIRLRGRLCAGEYTLPGDVSSQFVTGLMFALPLLEGESTLRILPPAESTGYIRMTLDTLRRCGIRISELGENIYRIEGGQHYTPVRACVEGDWSNAAFLFALNFCGGQVQVNGLRQDSLQGDRVCVELLQRLQTADTPLDLSDCPDLGPILFAMAAMGRGGEFTGIRRLRLKESDRVGAMAGELRKFGIEAVIGDDRMKILPGALIRPREPIRTHNDHRIAMALSVLCTLTGGVIDGAECVRKSYPDFFRDLQALGISVTLGN